MKKLLCTTAALLLLLGGNEVSAQLSWLDLIFPRNTQLEFTAGYGLFGRSERFVNTPLVNGSSQQYQRSMRPTMLLDQDIKLMPWINQRIGLVFGIGWGLHQFSLTEKQYYFNPSNGTYVLQNEQLYPKLFDVTARAIAGMTFRHEFTDVDRLLVKAYGGISPSMNLFTPNTDDLIGFMGDPHLRTLGGLEVGWQRDLARDLPFVPHMLLSYRFLQHFQNHPYSPAHVLDGIHQVVIGFGIAQGKDAWKKSLITF